MIGGRQVLGESWCNPYRSICEYSYMYQQILGTYCLCIRCAVVGLIPNISYLSSQLNIICKLYLWNNFHAILVIMYTTVDQNTYMHACCVVGRVYKFPIHYEFGIENQLERNKPPLFTNSRWYITHTYICFSKGYAPIHCYVVASKYHTSIFLGYKYHWNILIQCNITSADIHSDMNTHRPGVFLCWQFW